MAESPTQGPEVSAPAPAKRVAEALDDVLQDISQLLIATRDAHSSIRGALSFSLHHVAGHQHAQLVQALSVITKLMQQASSSLPSVSEGPEKLAAPNSDAEQASALIARLIDLHEASARNARNVAALAQAESDQTTSDLLAECVNFHVKAAWMLRALLN